MYFLKRCATKHKLKKIISMQEIADKKTNLRKVSKQPGGSILSHLRYMG